MQTTRPLAERWIAGTTWFSPICAALITPHRSGRFEAIECSFRSHTLRLARLRGRQHNFHGFPVLDQVIRLLPLLDGETMRDHGGHLEGAGGGHCQDRLPGAPGV